MYYVALKLKLMRPVIVEVVDNLEDAKSLCEIYRRKDLAKGEDYTYVVLTETN